jgi:glucokinase
MLLAGDLGGTTTRLGLFDAATPRPELRAVHEFATLDHSGLAPMVIEFLRQNDVGPEVVDVAAIGVAGPVVGQTARLTNVPWPVSAAELREQTGLARVELLNDAEAMALAVPVLRPDELAVIQAGTADPSGNALLLTVGTGLGVSFLHCVGGRLLPMPSEGGHGDFPSRTQREIDLVRYLLTLYGRVDMERVVSGRGLGNIADFVHGGRCPLAPLDLDDADYPAHVTTAATQATCASCVDAFGLFLEAFGSVAGTMAIIAVARGGVFIGGGIPPKILEPLGDGRFVQAFRSKPPMTDLLAHIPVSVVLDSRAGLLGAAVHAATVPERDQPFGPFGRR